MDLKSLHSLVVLSQHLHFTNASRQLHLSPSTLSRIIKGLEEELGVQVFERDQRSVVLTASGLKVKQTAQQILLLWQQLQQELSLGGELLTGKVKLYCSVTASYSLLSTMLPQLRQRHPKIEVVVETGDASEGILLVQREEVDLAIAPMPRQLPDTIAFKTFAKTPLLFIGPSVDCPLKRQIESGLWQWSDLPVLLAEHGVARERLLGWFEKKNIMPNIYAQIAGHEAIVSMVALGQAIGVVPELVLNNSPMREQVMILPLEPRLADFEIGLVTLKKRMRQPVLDAFWQLIN